LAAVFPDNPGLGNPPGTPAQQNLPGLIHGLAQRAMIVTG
jgi:hypothetical protein